MTDDPKVAELLAKVRGATGPDRDIDRWVQHLVVNDGRRGRYKSSEAWVRAAREQRWNTPHITRSIDEVLALVESKLPGWTWCKKFPSLNTVALCRPNQGLVIRGIEGRGATVSLALLAALLTALQSHKEQMP